MEKVSQQRLTDLFESNTEIYLQTNQRMKSLKTHLIPNHNSGKYSNQNIYCDTTHINILFPWIGIIYDKYELFTVASQKNCFAVILHKSTMLQHKYSLKSSNYSSNLFSLQQISNVSQWYSAILLQRSKCSYINQWLPIPL